LNEISRLVFTVVQVGVLLWLVCLSFPVGVHIMSCVWACNSK